MMLIQDKNAKLKQLENVLWEAASLLRGAVSAEDYKNYLLPLIFYKRLSDVFKDEVKRLKEDGIIDTFDEIYELAEYEKEEYGQVKSVRYLIPKEYLWDNMLKITKGLGEKLTEALRAIARENPELQGVIDIVDYNISKGGERIISDEVLAKVLQIINKLRLGLNDVEPDILGRAYEYLIRQFAEESGKKAGEFYTPYEVGLLMVRLLDPKPGEEVYDPACGSAGLLIKAQLYVREKYGKEAEEKPLKLYGQEVNHFTYAIAKMNVILHGLEADIRLGDTLRNPKFLENGRLKKFDKVIANPPWNDKRVTQDVYEKDKFNRFIFGIPPSSSADWGWIQHMYASLKDHGKLVVILDTGAVSRGSGSRSRNKEKEIRKKFVEKDLIEAVILTAENMFYNAQAPGVIIVINKNKPPERKGKILLVNASKEYVKGTPKNYLAPEHIEKIAKVYEEFKEVNGFSKIITIKEARENDYNLSPSRYIPIYDEEGYRSVDEIIQDLKELHREAIEIDKRLNRILQELGYEGYLNGDMY